ncbi:MAG: membrane-associated phospholipid phosphatase [Cyclobacteriaceae bacterium]|jgi:membrane-associated phospholipid phosphatase
MPLRARALYFTVLICFTSVTILKAQAPEKDCELCKNGKHSESRPYTLSLKQEVPFIITSALSLSAGFIAQAANNERFLNIGEINQLNKQGIFSFDRSAVGNNSEKAATYSDFFKFSMTLLPIYFVSNHHTKEDIWPLVAMSLEVLSTTYGLTNLAKNVVRRPRPFNYNDEVPLEKKLTPDAKRSFFSGHTSNTAAFTFFMAKVVTDYHPNMKKGLKTAMWGGAVLIPATTAYLRVKAGRHFPTDVIAGYVTGALVGFLIPHLHKKKDKGSVMSWNPVVLDNYTGLSMSIKLGQGRK